MEKQVKTKVWEQQPKESDPAYAAFSIYRDMGKNRTVAAVVRECGKNRSLIDRWHKGHNWAARCRAYDNSIDEEARKKAAVEAANIRKTHLQIAAQLQLKALNALNLLAPEDMTPRDIKEMAGGKFDKLAGKTRPGTYINFKSERTDTVGTSERGTAIIPLMKPAYGPAGTYIELTNAGPDAAYAKLGFSVYDSDANRQMLLIREAFKNANKVLVYIVKDGTKATATNEATPTLTATAKYGGSRGNALTVTVAANPVEGFDVTVSLAGNTVAFYESLTTVDDLIAQNCEYITFTGSGALAAVAAMNLTGGTDATPQNSDVTAFLDTLEGVKFNTVAIPTTDSSLQAAIKTKIKYLRESMGRGVQAVIPNFAADYEGIISVKNGYSIDDDNLSAAEACAWVAGATAGASYTESLTYKAVDGATGLNPALTHEEYVDAINKGHFAFSVSEENKIIAEYDINSLTSFKQPKDETYRKNRVIRVMDTFQESVQLNFPPNKYANSSVGWDIMEGVGKSILKQFEDVGAITNVDYDADFLVDREASYGDKTYFDVNLQPVDSAEKLFFTVHTH